MASLFERASRRLNRELALRLATKPLRVQPERPIVSFTFDDFPKTALTIGGDLLSHQEWRATYYTSLGMMAEEESDEGLFERANLDALIAAGHEIGCHTFDHVVAHEGPGGAFRASVEKSAREFEKLFPGIGLQTFAYPQGSLTLSAKRVVRDRFSAARGISDGVNRGVVDAGHLHGCSLTDQNKPLESRLQLIEENARVGGWLIFYTHEVQDAPSKYGCSPDYFGQVIKAVKSSGATVLPVADALKLIEAKC